MTSYLSGYLRLFQNLILPGFFYFLAVLVLIRTYTDIELIKVVKKNKKFLVYISILVLVISFIMGLMAHLALQELKSLFIERLNDVRAKCSVDQDSYINIYGVLIMIRHLIFSIFFLVISITIYFKRTKKRLNNKGFFTLMYASLFLILSLAYFKIKDVLDKMRIGEPICWKWILIVILILFLISFICIITVNSCNNFKRKLNVIFSRIFLKHKK